MNKYLQNHYQDISQQVIKGLEENNMKGFYVDSAKAVVPLVKTLIEEGETIAFGGSVTLRECGVADLVKNGNYKFLDRSAPGITLAQKEKMLRDVFFCDTFMASVNAITLDGRLYNIDGIGTRVAPMIFGPKRVIVIASVNKVVVDIKAANDRVKTISAPANCKQLGANTFCATEGYCIDVNQEIGKNPHCKNTICCDSVIFSRQRIKNRIQVILVGENLGY